MEHIEAAQTRKSSKKAVRKAQEEATAQTTSSRLQFTEEELATPELERYIEKSNKAADQLDAAKAAIPKQKKLVKERTFDEAAGKAKTRLHFEEQEKPMPGGKATATRYPAPRRKRVFLFTTKSTASRKTIPARRARTNRRNLPSAAQGTGQGNSNRATAAIS